MTSSSGDSNFTGYYSSTVGSRFDETGHGTSDNSTPYSNSNPTGMEAHSNDWLKNMPSHVDSSHPVVYMAVTDPNVEAGLRKLGNYHEVRDINENDNGATKMFLLDDNPEVNSDSQEESQEEEAEDVPKQNSFVTIFSIWNTMMGTSILAMPWALSQAGFGFGLFLIVAMAAIACYTGYLTVQTTEDIRILRNLPKSVFLDITDACQYHLGKAGRLIALIFSQVSLLGASIVYYVLLSNFLFYTGEYIYQLVNHESPKPPEIDGNVLNITNIYCPRYTKPQSDVGAVGDEIFQKLWVKDRTVPAWLLLILFPLISIKSPTCLGKFTTLATVSVIYLFILIGIKGAGWGVNMSQPPLVDPVPQARGMFPALTGTCSLALYIHNALHTILRAQRNPENNVRDISIAFGFTTATYALMGMSFFIVFPVSKYCIEDNYLNNLVTDIPVFIGRLALLFQMSMVYPMLVYILRAQIMHAIFKNIYPTWYYVLIVHIIVLGLGMLFAMVYPSIGTIIRFIGALCGLVFIFTIPTVITLMNKWILGHQKIDESMEYLSDEKAESMPRLSGEFEVSDRWVDKRTKTLWIVRCFFYSVIILLGLLNFIAQFVLLAYE